MGGPPNRCPPEVGRAELHLHLLAGVDDGPRTIDESVELAELAVRDGTSTVVATPHVRDIDLDELPERVESLRRRLDEAHGPAPAAPCWSPRAPR